MSSHIDFDCDAGDSATRKIREARSILEVLDFPRTQLNDRSALTLLALLDDNNRIPHGTDAQKPLRGITPIMDRVGTIMVEPMRRIHEKHFADRRCTSSWRRRWSLPILIIQTAR